MPERDKLIDTALARWSQTILRQHYLMLDKLHGEPRKLYDEAFKNGRQLGQIEERMKAIGHPSSQTGARS